jgi:hypothetical protein
MECDGTGPTSQQSQDKVGGVAPAALCIALVAVLTGSAHAGVALEARKLPMKFSWVSWQPNCGSWVSAVGVVTTNTPGDFDEFARGRQLRGTTIVLDSCALSQTEPGNLSHWVTSNTRAAG